MSMASPNRWLDWQPKAPIIENSPLSEPTKPSKPSSVGFVGSTLGGSPIIQAEPDQAGVQNATALLNAAGVRVMLLDGLITVGIWSDLDALELRAALAVIGMGALPVRLLDGPGVPLRYKVRSVPERDRGLSWLEWEAKEQTTRKDRC